MSLLTETEAKTKWCPLSRVLVGGTGHTANANYNRLAFTDHQPSTLLFDWTHCIGSACMAWRNEYAGQEVVTTNNESLEGGFAIRAVPPPGDGWINYDAERGFGNVAQTTWRRPRNSERGYCGAFGKAE